MLASKRVVVKWIQKSAILEQNRLRQMSERSGVRSFFGGPLSTREKCKAALLDCTSDTGVKKRKKTEPIVHNQMKSKKESRCARSAVPVLKSKLEFDKRSRLEVLSRASLSKKSKNVASNTQMYRKLESHKDNQTKSRTEQVSRQNASLGMKASTKASSAISSLSGSKRKVTSVSEELNSYKRRQTDAVQRTKACVGFFDRMRSKNPTNDPGSSSTQDPL